MSTTRVARRRVSEYPRDGREARFTRNNRRLARLHRDLIDTERQIRHVRMILDYPELAEPQDKFVEPERRLAALAKRRDLLRGEIADEQARLLEKREGRA